MAIPQPASMVRQCSCGAQESGPGPLELAGVSPNPGPDSMATAAQTSARLGGDVEVEGADQHCRNTERQPSTHLGNTLHSQTAALCIHIYLIFIFLHIAA
ncbi:MAG: hypothetical protein CM1200mP41_31160 [Gammaproteobacteria bacterium]|nr:MAG: hypothetical protein CM1200mP41_31160 [Gammaproteobacteria bacterium]